MEHAANTLVSRALVLERFNEPLQIREFTVPAAEPGGAVVACHYGGICGTDLHLQQGHLKIPTPLILGHEGLGTIHHIGADLTHDANGEALGIGDVVMWASSIACGQCVPCRIHREPTLCERRRTCGVNRTTLEYPSLSGAWAEYICLCTGSTIIKLPKGIDPLAAMSFACAGPTMVHAMYERRPVRLGEVVVVQGSGPVGLAAAALAQLAGAGRVIIIGGPAQRIELAKQARIGDDHVNIVNSAGARAALEQVKSMLGPRGADLVIECTGVPSAIAQGMSLVRRGGSYLVVGQYTDAGDTTINPHQIVLRQMDVVGSWAFTGAHVVEYVRLLAALTARFDLKSLVTSYSIERCGEAMAAVADGSVMKAVLSMRPT